MREASVDNPVFSSSTDDRNNILNNKIIIINFLFLTLDFAFCSSRKCLYLPHRPHKPLEISIDLHTFL